MSVCANYHRTKAVEVCWSKASLRMAKQAEMVNLQLEEPGTVGQQNDVQLI
jgi:hypothetical protein